MMLKSLRFQFHFQIAESNVLMSRDQHKSVVFDVGFVFENVETGLFLVCLVDGGGKDTNCEIVWYKSSVDISVTNDLFGTLALRRLSFVGCVWLDVW